MKKKKIYLIVFLTAIITLIIIFTIFALKKHKKSTEVNQDVQINNDNTVADNLENEKNIIVEENSNNETILDENNDTIPNVIEEENNTALENQSSKPSSSTNATKPTETKPGNIQNSNNNQNTNDNKTEIPTNPPPQNNNSDNNNNNIVEKEEEKHIDLSKYDYYEEGLNGTYKGFKADSESLNILKNLIDECIKEFGYTNVKVIEDSSLTKSGIFYFTANKTNVQNAVYLSDGFTIYYYAVKEYAISGDGTERFFQTRSYIKVK